MQTLDLLKVLLDRDGVEYNERKFSTDDGISGLGDNPFVSPGMGKSVLKNKNIMCIQRYS